MTSFLNKTLIIISVLLSSCSTLINRNQIISIESSPPGLAVYKENDNLPIGKTPNYFLIRRAKQHNFNLLHAGKKYNFTKACQTQWANFGNFALTSIPLLIFAAPLSFILTPIGYAVDWLTDSYYNCSNHFYFDLKLKPKKKTDICRTYLVYGPHNLYLDISYKIADFWKEKTKHNLKSCDKFVSSKKTNKYTQQIHIKPSKLDWHKKLTPNNRAFLGFKTKANSLIILDLKNKKELLVSKQFDLINLRSINPISPPLKANEEIFIKDNSIKILSLLFHFLPNNIRLGAKATFADLKQNKFNNPVSSIYTSISHIENNNAYGDWDLIIKASPELSFQSYSAERKFIKWLNPTNKQEHFQWRWSLSSFNIKGELSLFSPIGKFTLGTGLGGSIINNYSSNQKDTIYLDIIGFAEISYTAFINDSYFVFSNVRRSYLNKGIKKEIATENLLQSAEIGIGYYSATMFDWLR